MADNSLIAEVREQGGKGVARKLRAAGRIPAVVYGDAQDSVALSLDPRELERLLRSSATGMNTLIDLAYGGKTVKVLVKDLQREPVRGSFLHADFFRVNLREEIEVDVPIHLIGEARGVKLDGGILDHSLRELTVSCLPTAIPDAINVDVSGLEIGSVLHVSDLQLPEGVRVRTEPGTAVASVVLPSEEEAAPAEVAPSEVPVGDAAAAPAAETAEKDED